MARIFLSYRRGDAGPAGRLHDELAARFGDSNVIGDIYTNHAGEDFAEGIRSAIDSADVCLAVIGRSWFDADERGVRQIDNPNDFVRLEVAAALARDIPVIPVLVGGAPMPNEEDLPTELRPLARRQALELRDLNWGHDVEDLCRVVDRIDRPARPEEQQQQQVLEQLLRQQHQAQKPVEQRLRPEGDRPLSTMFRDAALAGVVSEAVVTSRQTEAVPPQAMPAPSPSMSRDYGGGLYKIDRPEASDGGCLGTGVARLWWVALLPAAVLLGAGLVIARWLLGVFVEGGEPVQRDESTPARGDVVTCTVFAPPSAAPGDTILVQAFAHLPEQTDDAAAIARELDLDALRRTFQSLAASVPVGGRLDFELRMPGLEVDDPVASLIWRRRAEAVQFGVRVPTSAPEGAVIGTLEVSLDSAPIGQIKFKLAIDRRAAEAGNEPQGDHARRYEFAFISYASQDREKVLARVQMLSAIGVRYFQDLLSLEPGDRWERKLELGIDECDIFLLFWSSEAKDSQWVRREVRYALDRRGGDELSPPEIRPVILEGPPIIDPWEELAHLHFNDRLLYFMRPPGAE